LADNWNIDIAQELEEYISEIQSIEVSLDGGKSTINFAEGILSQ
jgi:condensin-2 complex subunit H2